MPRPSTVGTRGSPCRSWNYRETPWHQSPPQLSSWGGDGTVKPHRNIWVQQTALAWGKATFPNLPRSNLRSWG